MFKKFMSLALALVMALGLVAGAVDYKDADDIADYAEKAVQFVYDLNIMQGDNHGNFNPKKPITREEMFRVMYALYNAGDINASSLYEATLDGSGFKDAGEVNSWARKFAGYNIAKGIFKGSGKGGYLRPKANISYVEVAVLFLRTLGYSDEYFKNYSSILNWDQNVLLLSHELGILDGLSITDGNAAASREDIAVIVYNALTKAETVKFDKETGKFEKTKTKLGEEMYGKYGVVEGLVISYTKDTYTVATTLGEKNVPAGPVTYKLASGETLDTGLVGKFVRWSYRKDNKANRINNLAVVADGKLVEEVSLSDISFDVGKKKLTVGSVEIDLSKVDDKNILLYTAGNGVNGINYNADVLNTIKAGDVINESYKVSVAYNKVKVGDVEKHIIGLLGLYDLTYTVDSEAQNVIGFAQVTKVDGSVVKLKFAKDGKEGKEYFAIANNSVAKDDVVFVEADFADMILGKNNNEDLRKKAGDAKENTLYNVNLTKLSPVTFKGEKFAVKTVGDKEAYYLDGKQIKKAATADKGLDMGDIGSFNKDTTYVVYMIDNFVYFLNAYKPGTTAPTFAYGLFVDQYFNANGAFVRVLMADGETRDLPVSKVSFGRWKDDKGNEKQNDAEKVTMTNMPVKYDPNTLIGIFGIDKISNPGGKDYNLVPAYSVVTYEVDGDKYIVYAGNTHTMLYGKDKSLVKETVLADSNLKYKDKKIGDDIYTNDTVFFVIYKGEDGTEVKVCKASDLKADQTNGSAYYVAEQVVEGSSVNVIKVAVLDLRDTTPDVIKDVETADVKILLTENPTVVETTVANETTYEVILTGIVNGELKKDVSYSFGKKNPTDDLEDVVEGALVGLNLTDGKVTEVNVLADTWVTVNEYLPSITPDKIKLDTETEPKTLTISDKAKMYALDDEMKPIELDLTEYQIGENNNKKTHQALVETDTEGKIITIFFRPIP